MPPERIAAVVALAVGLLDLLIYLAWWAGLTRPGRLLFRKLEPMRQRWGARAGTALHFTGYVIAPLAFGAFLLLR
jgi:hypothetical protein